MISIFSDMRDNKQKLFSSTTVDKTAVLSEKFKLALESVKEQFEDHLDAINENTNEIQSNFEYLCMLDRKIDKMSERMEELTMLLRKQQGIEDKKFKFLPLTKKEKDVFFALYVLSQEKEFVCYKDLSRRMCESESLISSYITNLVEKGIPIMKKYAGKIVLLSIDPEFRKQQTKKNIVGLNTKLTHWIG